MLFIQVNDRYIPVHQALDIKYRGIGEEAPENVPEVAKQPHAEYPNGVLAVPLVEILMTREAGSVLYGQEADLFMSILKAYGPVKGGRTN